MDLREAVELSIQSKSSRSFEATLVLATGEMLYEEFTWHGDVASGHVVGSLDVVLDEDMHLKHEFLAPPIDTRVIDASRAIVNNDLRDIKASGLCAEFDRCISSFAFISASNPDSGRYMTVSDFV